MRNVFLLLFALVFISATSEKEVNKENELSQYSIEILVIDAKTKEPIPAAQIKIIETDIKTYTNFDGIANIEDIETGTYDIEISFVSYQKKLLKAFQVNKLNNKFTVKLNP